jgi:PAS domain-containing protein
MKASLDVRQARNEEFKALTEEFCRMAQKEDVRVAPYSGAEPKFFPQLPEAMQIPILNSFRRYVDVAREVQANDGFLRDEQTFLWRMLQKLKLHPPSNLMSELRTGDVIEIHDPQLIQIYRSLSFFSICSYTLDDLLARPFWELLWREEHVTAQLLDMARTVLSGEVIGVQSLNIPEHPILELQSVERRQSVIQQRMAAPLRDGTGTIAAIVTALNIISSVSTVGSPKPHLVE